MTKKSDKSFSPNYFLDYPKFSEEGGKIIPTPPELPSKTFIGRAAPTLPSNGRDVGGLPANIRDDSGPLEDGRVVRDNSKVVRLPSGAPESEQRAKVSLHKTTAPVPDRDSSGGWVHPYS